MSLMVIAASVLEDGLFVCHRRRRGLAEPRARRIAAATGRAVTWLAALGLIDDTDAPPPHLAIDWDAPGDPEPSDADTHPAWGYPA